MQKKTRKKRVVPNGVIIKNAFEAKTSGQREYVRSISENKITICCGPAGSGKTFIAASLGIEKVLNGEFKRLIISRPLIDTGFKGLGFLPGDIENKIHPYMVPVLEELKQYIGYGEVDSLIREHRIVLVPLEICRGRNFNESFIILDEANNADYSQLKMFLTRFGRKSKMVINGDIKQTDIQGNKALDIVAEKLEGTRNINVVRMTRADIVRDEIISDILGRLEDD